MQGELHIGADAEKVVVSAYPLRMREGRATRRRTGSVTEFLPALPSGRSREARIAIACRVALSLMVVTAFLYATGVPWLLPALASATGLTLLWRRMARASRPGRFAVPADDESRVLWSEPERVAYERAVTVSRRIRRTWPALPDMIDPVTADRSLTRALGDLAAQMARRQEIRRLRAELQDVREQGVPGDSPAVLALAAQRERVEKLWLETAESANRVLRSLDAAARAGETFLREQRISDTARAAEQVLATLVPNADPIEAGPELATRTEAVISAYRELEVI
ncbi:hypothetical protein [Actinoplanes sp. NPDC051411]|uniref:hypothetical protein n=1 Tax=Actinoplanes sp. NPDC051411 TaxID=3155522 RepID=UPI00341A2FBC